MDNVPKEILWLLETEVVVTGQSRKGRSTSPVSHLMAKQTDGEKDDKEDNSDMRGRILCRDEKIVNIRHLSLGIFPCV